jgi:DNA-binding response OmpR family regulator
VPPARILIVEDDELTALVETAILESAGFEVEAVHTGEQALVRLAAATFDAMVLDLMLPGLRGEDLLRGLAPERLARMPVLVVSGYGDPDLIARLRSQGAADFLVKDGHVRVFDHLPKRMTELIAQRGAEH